MNFGEIDRHWARVAKKRPIEAACGTAIMCADSLFMLDVMSRSNPKLYSKGIAIWGPRHVDNFRLNITRLNLYMTDRVRDALSTAHPEAVCYRGEIGESYAHIVATFCYYWTRAFERICHEVDYGEDDGTFFRFDGKSVIANQKAFQAITRPVEPFLTIRGFIGNTRFPEVTEMETTRLRINLKKECYRASGASLTTSASRSARSAAGRAAETFAELKMRGAWEGTQPDFIESYKAQQAMAADREFTYPEFRAALSRLSNGTNGKPSKKNGKPRK